MPKEPVPNIPTEEEPNPAPAWTPTIEEPEPEDLPDEQPNPNPDENDEPPLYAL